MTFDFDNLEIGDRLKYGEIEVEYVLDINNRCDDCALFGKFGCDNIPCDRHHLWKEITHEKK